MEENTKQDLRERILTLLKSQKKEDRALKSSIILDKLFELPEFMSATTILFYAAFNGEVDTFEMMKKALTLGKKIGLPKINTDNKEIIPKFIGSLEDDLIEGPYGIPEPRDDNSSNMPLDDLGLVTVPGLAFDNKNNRLGRGGGYYDRFLKGLNSATSTVGLAFDFQIVNSLPHTEEHDMRVHHVLVN